MKLGKMQNALARRRHSGAAKRSSLRDKESATPEAGAGMFPAERCPGQRNISGSSASILRRPSHLSTYSWKRFTPKIDRLLSEVSMKQLKRKEDLTWNFESRLRTDLLSMSTAWADPSWRSPAKSVIIPAPRLTSPSASEERPCSSVKSVSSR